MSTQQITRGDSGPSHACPANPPTEASPVYPMSSSEKIPSKNEKTSNAATEEGRPKLGTIPGVFVPCLQNILGIILFIRLSWIVTQSGIWQSLIIVGLCCTTTTMTSLSLSACATNGQIKGGGPYYIISRLMGPKFGGAVGLCFYLGTTIAGSMYILGAVETLKLSIPGLVIYEPLDYQIIGLAVLLCSASLVYSGVELVSKVAPLFLVPVLLCVLGIFLGIVTADSRDLGAGITGLHPQNVRNNWEPNYDPGNNFATMLALFFPSVTGIMAGSNRSGDLKEPRVSIPRGTIGAVAVTSTLYLLMTYLYGTVADCHSSFALLSALGSRLSALCALCSVLRVLRSVLCYVVVPHHTPGAVADRSVLNDRSKILSAELAWPHSIMVRVGITLSTLGAGLQSLTGAPRLLQAIANDDLIPVLGVFRGSGEPTRALLLSCVICAGCVGAGNIDFVAPIITMFFLLCYMFVNLSVIIQEQLKGPNWRPRFKYYHSGTAVLGWLLCLFIMFYTNWYFALASILCAAAVFQYIGYRKVELVQQDSHELQTIPPEQILAPGEGGDASGQPKEQQIKALYPQSI